jgi:hypothetical protein
VPRLPTSVDYPGSALAPKIDLKLGTYHPKSTANRWLEAPAGHVIEVRRRVWQSRRHLTGVKRTDKSQLANMANQAKAALGAESLEAFAGRGYFKGEERLPKKLGETVKRKPGSLLWGFSFLGDPPGRCQLGGGFLIPDLAQIGRA